MIKNILDLLPLVKGETENIRIAKGKNKIPQSLKEGYKQQWLRSRLQEDCHRSYWPRYYIFLHRSEDIAANRGGIQEKAR